jgi:hypothetical protein
VEKASSIGEKGGKRFGFSRAPITLGKGTDIAQTFAMRAVGMHSYTKDQREAVSEMVRKVIVCDLGMFTPERFKDWIKYTDYQFRKTGLTLRFDIRNRVVHFTVKEVRTGRRAYHFTASTRVRFDDSDVVLSVEDISRKF